MPPPFHGSTSGLLLDVRLTPRGGRDGLEGTETLADGRVVVKARVRAVPENGRANAALEGLVAEAFGLSRSSVQVTKGATSRLKTVAVNGDPQALAALATRLFGALVILIALAFVQPVAAQGRFGPDICADQTEFMRALITAERAGLANADRGRVTRTIRAAQSMAEEGCGKRDTWLVRRAVGMLNAVNAELRRPPVDLPLAFRD
ncbi:MAG: DUF167 family protein [Alphaproteobacteria bacterium]